MSRFPVVSSFHGAGVQAGFPRRLVRPAKRFTCAAAIALAAAGCSQEVQRFDHSARESRTAQLHYNEERYAEDGFASWRRAERGDLDRRRAQLNGDPVTRSLPGDSEPLRSANSEDRGQLAPIYDRQPRPPRRTTHTVRAGDTLYSIARSHDVSVDALAEINGLADPGLIRIGDTLYIPEPGYARRAQAPDRQRSARPAPRRAERRPAPRDRRSAERRPRRYADDQLYVDPLLSDRPSREERRRSAPRRRAEERPVRDRRRAEDRPSGERRRTARRDTQAQQTRERISAAPPRRGVPATPPPTPRQRPETGQRNQVAQADQRTPNRAQDQPPKRVARLDPPKERDVAGEQKTSAADCQALMKNPPARSGANFRRPANGLIISRFGEQSNGQRNDGINISVPRGTPVKAAENGVVVYAGDELTGLGKLVLVRHADGWVSAYAHNDEILVRRCDTVERGQQIARAGVSGAVSKPQLHFELRKNARPVDPEQHLAGTS